MGSDETGRSRNLVNRGDVYMVTLDPVEGHEQRGHRPVVVISTVEFNRATQMPIIVPVTHGGGFARRRGMAVELSGLITTGIVRCDQPRALDLAARGAKHIENIGAELVEAVLAKVAAIFE